MATTPQRPLEPPETEVGAVPGDREETIGLPAPGAPTPPSELERVGPYRILKELGRGGMGAVYAALDTRLDRRLALKVMLPRYAADTGAKSRFLREARAAARIKHDNVVTVYEADERDGVPYIAMEFLEGCPLDKYLRKKGSPTIPQVVRIAAEAAAGLGAAHKLGLVHRDIKPGNLWLEAPNGRVKVLDFGLAKPMDGEVELTKQGTLVGTPAFMSPEQARGENVDARSDLFSLGALLYRLCTGKLPFEGSTTMAVLMALAGREPQPIRELNPSVPDSLATLIHQLLAKQADERPQTADEVVKRLRSLGQERAVPSTQAVEKSPSPVAQASVSDVPIQVTVLPPEANPFAEMDADADVTEQESVTVPEPARPASRGKRMWIYAGIAATLLVAVVGVILVAKNKDSSEKKLETAGGTSVPVKPKDPKTLPPVTPPKVTTAKDPDRKAAEFILSVGGALKVAVDDQDREIKTLAELPKERFLLKAVWLTKATVTDADMANFEGCKDIWLLDLPSPEVTDAGLVHLKDCTATLKHLNLSGTKVTDAGMVHLQNCKGLAYFNLGFTTVTDKGLAHFKGIKDLMRLELYETKITGPGLHLTHDSQPEQHARVGCESGLFQELQESGEPRIVRYGGDGRGVGSLPGLQGPWASRCHIHPRDGEAAGSVPRRPPQVQDPLRRGDVRTQVAGCEDLQ